MRTTLLILCFLFPANAWANKAELVYDGNWVGKTTLFERGGSLYLSIQSVASFFKGKTQWYPVAEKVVLQLNNHKITFKAGVRTIGIDKGSIALEDAPRLYRGTLYIPIEFITSPNFGKIANAKIRWNDADKSLSAESHATLLPPRIFTRSQSTKVILESLEEISPVVKRRSNIISIDIPKAKIANEEIYRFKEQPIEFVKTSHARKGAAIKIGLAPSATTYVWRLEENPHRLTVEIPSKFIANGDMAVLTPAQPVQPQISVHPSQPKESKPKEEKVETPLKKERSPPFRKIKRIVIDAGHGGKDPGAIGRRGTKEKEVNLMIALELARVLSIEGGYETILTRQDDAFISLLDRSLFANEKGADLFVSIHCNAAMRKAESGFEIFYLAESASDPHAESTAEFENAVVKLEGPEGAKKRQVQDLLFSMARNEFLNESSLLCHTIARAVKKRTSAQARGVKQANFHVLHGVQMPSVLVETGFLTNAGEEQNLRKRKYRSSMIDAIVTGIENYENQLSLLGKAR